MKITLDIDQLLHDGRISQDEHARLKQLGSETTSALGLNILLAFGILTVAGGAIVLLRSSGAAAALGLVLAVVGGVLTLSGSRWVLLGNILLPLGALTGGGGMIATTEGSVGGFLLVAALLAAGALAADSGLLAAFAVFALLSALGGATGYDHAAYFLCIRHPLLTVGVFGGLAALAFFASLNVPPRYARLAVIVARTAVVVVNFGFWVGSLWGDRTWDMLSSRATYVVGWAVCLVAAGILGARWNRRWLVNAAATFGAIHLYTQWFERLGASPISLIAAGLTLIAIACTLIYYNRRTPNQKRSDAL
jgi:hypothetical protein